MAFLIHYSLKIFEVKNKQFLIKFTLKKFSKNIPNL